MTNATEATSRRALPIRQVTGAFVEMNAAGAYALDTLLSAGIVCYPYYLTKREPTPIYDQLVTDQESFRG